MRRVFRSLITTAVLASALMACGRPDGEAIDVTVIGTAAPSLADPASGPLSQPSEVLLANAGQGLVRFDARGQIDAGLAETWNVSDDGLSYIFRLATGDWPDGRPIVARDVARILNRELKSSSRNPLKDTLGAVDEIVAMTDRVIEVRLKAPRPFLLQLLAQPQFAVIREGQGTGPFQIEAKQAVPGAIALKRNARTVGDESSAVELVHLRHGKAGDAIHQFQSGKAALVLGGTFADLPLVPRDRRTRNVLHFDPVAGLFGLAPARAGGPIADEQLRRLLSQAVNRDAFVTALNVPGLVARTTILQAGLEGGSNPVVPAWSALPFQDRYAQAVRQARAAIGPDRLTLAIALPEGRGADLLFNRLKIDWAPLGVDLVRARKGATADLKLVDEVAPSNSPAWFVRSFRCGVAPVCIADADALMNEARDTQIEIQRTALLGEAGRMLDEKSLFLPLAAPIRWSLVSADLPGFAENIFARHPLSGLRDKPTRERQ
jgi:peptide/nickel transport system substrate-binding protein